MTSRERVWAALRGEPVDRPPVAFWGHFYHRESTAAELVAATGEFQREYGWDWIKLNPRKQYHVEDWGVRYQVSGRPGEKPKLVACPVHDPADWDAIGERPHDRGALGEQIEAVRLMRRVLPAGVPLLQTVFTPLAVLGEMTETPEEVKQAMRDRPASVRAALDAVTATYERYVAEVLAAGADGLYFATVDWASQPLMSAAEYDAWSRPWDLRVLAAARNAPFHVLHVCRGRNLLLGFRDYPVHAFSYDASDPTNPTVEQALAALPGAFVGGISHEGSLQDAGTERVLAEYRSRLATTKGRRWLVGPGCSIPPSTPAANLRAVRAAVDATRLPMD